MTAVAASRAAYSWGVADPLGQSEPETIEHGRRGRQGRAAYPPRWLRVVLAALVLVLAAGALVVDHRVRRQESVRVAGCTSVAVSAVRFANVRVDAIAEYVRPALESELPRAVRNRLLRLVSTSVAPMLPDVRRALDTCGAVRLLPIHGDLRSRQHDCLRLLRRERAYVVGISADGLRAFDPRSLPAGRCTGPTGSAHAAR
jgi:hypothetical protein